MCEQLCTSAAKHTAAARRAQKEEDPQARHSQIWHSLLGHELIRGLKNICDCMRSDRPKTIAKTGKARERRAAYNSTSCPPLSAWKCGATCDGEGGRSKSALPPLRRCTGTSSWPCSRDDCCCCGGGGYCCCGCCPALLALTAGGGLAEAAPARWFCTESIEERQVGQVFF
jgi:hypothetical protein